MKVALVHWRLFNMGGLESRIRNYLAYFHERGDDVTIFCYKQSPDFPVPPSVKVVKLHLGAMPKPYRMWYFNHKLGKIFNKEDYDFSLTMGRTTQQTASLAPGDHLGFLEAIKRKIRKPKDWTQINLDKLSFASSDIIFPCSDFIKQNLINLYGVSPSKLHTIYPPLDVSRFKRLSPDEKSALADKYGMDKTKTTFVIASTAHKRKGIPLLLKLFKRLQDQPVELLIAGRPKVRTRLPNVKFIGYVKKSEELFAAADFSIHPALYEPFGQVISESLACGTPVLISNNTGWSTNLPESYGRVVPTFSVEDWKAALLESIDKTYSIPENFGEVHELSLEKHMEKMLKYYGEMVGKDLS